MKFIAALVLLVAATDAKLPDSIQKAKDAVTKHSPKVTSRIKDAAVTTTKDLQRQAQSSNKQLQREFSNKSNAKNRLTRRLQGVATSTTRDWQRQLQESNKQLQQEFDNSSVNNAYADITGSLHQYIKYDTSSIKRNNKYKAHDQADLLELESSDILPTIPDLPVGTATASSTIFNLIKAIVGAGILGLPAGIAAVGGGSPDAVAPALAIMLGIGIMSAYNFQLLGQLCSWTSSTSYRQLWNNIIGPKTAWIPASATFLVTFGSVITYSMVLADTIPTVMAAVGLPRVPRTNALLGVTTFILLPLTLMRDMSALAPFSLVGIGGAVYTTLVMVLRWLTKSYKIDTGRFFGQVDPTNRPIFTFDSPSVANFATRKAAILIAMLSTAYQAHYHAPRLYWDLENREEYPKVVWTSFGSAAVLMGLTAAAGFLTFGAASRSFILSNYAVTDPLLSLSRLAVTISLIFSYPLAFLGVRDGLLDIINVPADWRQTIFTPLTIILLAIVTSLAMVVKDIGFIMSLNGATWGTCLIYIFPAIMLRQLVKNTNGANVEAKRNLPTATFTSAIGLMLGVVGAYQALTK